MRASAEEREARRERDRERRVVARAAAVHQAKFEALADVALKQQPDTRSRERP
jgi:hypothetical protein